MSTQTGTDQFNGRITPNLFGISYGLAGLATCWVNAAALKLAPVLVGQLLLIVTTVVWLLLVAGYVGQVWHRPGRWTAELADPVRGPFVSLIPIVGMLVAIGIMPSARTFGRLLFALFAIVTIALAGWVTGQWIIDDLDLDRLHSGYVLPAVAGGLIAAIGAATAGWAGLAWAAFGIGLVSWLLLDSIILARLFFRGPLPRPLVPTLAIEMVPPALANLAYLAIRHGRADAFAAALGGATLLAVMVQIRLFPLYRRLRFTLGFWSFAFPSAAVATVALHWLEHGRPPAHQLWAYIVILVVTGFIVTLAARTTRILVQGGFIPPIRGRRRPRAGTA